MRTRKIVSFLTIMILIYAVHPVSAETCDVKNRSCLLEMLEASTSSIENKAWRDQSYRELAKTLAFEGHIEDALNIIDSIQTPDTKAMTIRGIGMTIAEQNLSSLDKQKIYKELRASAEKIEHPPSYAIALTYIAMSQAFAGDNEEAWATAADMKNDALRHKAYAETAEIQAEKGDFQSAMKSISFIESSAFKNKAYSIVAKILAGRGQLQHALDAAALITNPYKKSQSIQFILDTQKPRDASKNQLKTSGTDH